MIKICFVRHGISEWNIEGRAQGQKNPPLSQEGVEQAKRVAQRLGGDLWDVIYSSDLSRASATAEHIAKELCIPDIYIDKRLRERCGGNFEGTTELERIQTWGENWKQCESGFEEDEAIVARGLECLNDIITTHSDQAVIVVSHGGLLRRLFCHLLNEEVHPLKNTSVTILTKNGVGWQCEVYNCVAHLEQQGMTPGHLP